MVDESNGRHVTPGDPVAIAPRGVDGISPYSPSDGALIMGGAEPDSGGVSTTLNFAAILRYKWTMLVVFVVLAGISIPAIWLLIKPFYSTFATVRIAPIVPRIVFDTDENGKMPLYHSFVATQLSVFQSPDLLRRVIEDEKVAQTEWANAKPGFFERNQTLLERLRDSMNIRRRPGTEIVSVHVRAYKAEDAQIIADSVVDHYKELADEKFGVAGSQKLRVLEEQRTRLDSEIEGLVELKYRISAKLGTLGPEELRSQMAMRLQSLEAEQSNIERQHAMLTWEIDMAKAAREGKNTDSGVVENPNETGIDRKYANDAQWRNLYTALKNAKHQLELARQKFGEQHPQIQTLLANIAFSEGLLAERENEIQSQFVMASPDGTAGDVFGPAWDKQQALLRLEKELELVTSKAAEQRAQVASAGEVAKDMAKFDEQLRRKRSLLNRVRSRIEAYEVESKAPARITVGSHAMKPGSYASDRRFLLSALALIASAMMGAAVAYLRASLNPKIVAANDVRSSVRVPFLGQLPPLGIVENDLTDYDPAILESMRMVRTALLERVEPGRDQIILVTSSSSGVGKTTVATLLASSLARLGKRTLLVDADLRTATLSRRLATDKSKGLACLLTNEATDEDVIVPGPVPKLDLVPAGQALDQFDPELLANGQFSASLNRWRKNYDFILLDSSPVLPVADARILASQADGTLMVLRSSHCRRTDVTRAYADLGAAGGKLLGTVLVGVRRDEAYGYTYGYGYGTFANRGRAELPEPKEVVSTAREDA